MVCTGMSSEDAVELLQGTLDLIVLRALASMGPQHAYGLAARLQQVADHALPLNQGTLYVALVRLEQKGWIKGAWRRTETNRDAKYYALTRRGRAGLARETGKWLRLAGFVGKLIAAPER
jgi:PadR family transcriptional regulator PadR